MCLNSSSSGLAVQKDNWETVNMDISTPLNILNNGIKDLEFLNINNFQINKKKRNEHLKREEKTIDVHRNIQSYKQAYEEIQAGIYEDTNGNI